MGLIIGCYTNFRRKSGGGNDPVYPPEPGEIYENIDYIKNFYGDGPGNASRIGIMFNDPWFVFEMQIRLKDTAGSNFFGKPNDWLGGDSYDTDDAFRVFQYPDYMCIDMPERANMMGPTYDKIIVKIFCYPYADKRYVIYNEFLEQIAEYTGPVSGRVWEDVYFFVDHDKAELYSASYYKIDTLGNEELIYDLRPVRRISDNELGLLNIIDNQFFNSINGGLFGPEPEPEIVSVEHVDAVFIGSGLDINEQPINIGCAAGENTTMWMDCVVNSWGDGVNNDARFFGAWDENWQNGAFAIRNEGEQLYVGLSNVGNSYDFGNAIPQGIPVTIKLSQKDGEMSVTDLRNSEVLRYFDFKQNESWERGNFNQNIQLFGFNETGISGTMTPNNGLLVSTITLEGWENNLEAGMRPVGWPSKFTYSNGDVKYGFENQFTGWYYILKDGSDGSAAWQNYLNYVEEEAPNYEPVDAINLGTGYDSNGNPITLIDNLQVGGGDINVGMEFCLKSSNSTLFAGVDSDEMKFGVLNYRQLEGYWLNDSARTSTALSLNTYYRGDIIFNGESTYMNFVDQITGDYKDLTINIAEGSTSKYLYDGKYMWNNSILLQHNNVKGSIMEQPGYSLKSFYMSGELQEGKNYFINLMPIIIHEEDGSDVYGLLKETSINDVNSGEEIDYIVDYIRIPSATDASEDFAI